MTFCSVVQLESPGNVYITAFGNSAVQSMCTGCVAKLWSLVRIHLVASLPWLWKIANLPDVFLNDTYSALSVAKMRMCCYALSLGKMCLKVASSQKKGCSSATSSFFMTFRTLRIYLRLNCHRCSSNYSLQMYNVECCLLNSKAVGWCRCRMGAPTIVRM